MINDEDWNKEAICLSAT